jgi:Domain of unknown function (DUF4034)
MSQENKEPEVTNKKAESKQPQSKPISKVILFGVIAIVLLSPIALWRLVTAAVPQLSDAVQELSLPPWRVHYRQAKDKFANGSKDAEATMKQAIGEAERDKVDANSLLNMHRGLAAQYYWQKRYSDGDEQITEAIAAIKGEPKQNSAEASGLSHAYQDRGWFNYLHWVKEGTGSNGVADQEKSVEIADKYFGPDSAEAVYKLASLVVMYHDTKDSKAKSALDRMIDTIEHRNSAQQASWFAYAMIAHTRALQRDYPAAVNAYLTAVKLADGNNADRCREELENGLMRNAPRKDDPAMTKAIAMYKEGKYDDLDQIATEMVKKKTTDWKGKWEIGSLLNNLTQYDSRYSLSEEDHRQIIFDLKKYAKASPKSPFAKIGLSLAYVDYAWFARGSGWANSVTEQGWRDMRARLERAKDYLNSDPDTFSRCPSAFSAMSNVGLGTSMEKSDYMALLGRAHKLWPTYVSIDGSACTYLLPRWFGQEGEWVRYAESRAKAVGGVDGDVWYTRMVMAVESYYKNIFKEEKEVSWARIKSGFEKMCADNPDSVGARLEFIKFARQAGHDQDIKTVFDNYKPSN